MARFYLLACCVSEEVLYEDRCYLFLGEWNLSYPKKNLPKNYQILPYHWDNRKKFIKDCEYLDDIYEEYLFSVSDKLNAEHKTNFPVRYWRVLIGPWLGEFIQILYDRWETIQSALAFGEIEGVSSVESRHEDCIPNDMLDFQKKCIEDEWNELIFSQLLQFTNLNVNYKKNNHRKVESRKSLNSALKIYVKRLGNWLSCLFGGSKHFMIQTYLSNWDQFVFQISLGQLPRFWSSPSSPKVNCRSYSILRTHSKQLKTDQFKTVLDSMLFRNMPLIYLEGYKELINSVNCLNWPKNPKTIFTSNSYESDDIFKAWAAQKIIKGSKLLIGQHGGGYGMMKYFFYETHQLKIADYFLTWGWERKFNRSIIPVGMFIKGIDKKLTRGLANKILLIECAIPRYSTHLASMFISSQWLNYFNNLSSFYASLPKYLQECLSLRLYPIDYGWDREKRWLHLFPDIRFNRDKGGLVKAIKTSKVCICTYNGTTYLQCLAMNVPTILFWDSAHWEMSDLGAEHLEDLKSVGIFHTSPAAAAEYLEKIWPNVDEWWCSQKVQDALKKFNKQFADTSRDYNGLIKKLCQRI